MEEDRGGTVPNPAAFLIFAATLGLTTGRVLTSVIGAPSATGVGGSGPEGTGGTGGGVRGTEPGDMELLYSSNHIAIAHLARKTLTTGQEVKSWWIPIRRHPPKSEPSIAC
jgi:hypothetical protein